jgi:hypothetical protein
MLINDPGIFVEVTTRPVVDTIPELLLPIAIISGCVGAKTGKGLKAS